MHGPGDGHHHGSGEENYAGRRHPEQVVLDIGQGIGALILHTDSSMHGVEVEISAAGQDDRRSHKDVLEREINGRPAYTAVFDKLSEGAYTLWVDGVAREHDVIVTGGAISELEWFDRAARATDAAVRRPADPVGSELTGAPPRIVAGRAPPLRSSDTVPRSESG